VGVGGGRGGGGGVGVGGGGVVAGGCWVGGGGGAGGPALVWTPYYNSALAFGVRFLPGTLLFLSRSRTRTHSTTLPCPNPSHHPALPRPAPSCPAGEGAAPPSPSSDSSGGVEHMLLVALEALHNDDREKDVRLGVLRVLLSILQVSRVTAIGAARSNPPHPDPNPNPNPDPSPTHACRHPAPYARAQDKHAPRRNHSTQLPPPLPPGPIPLSHFLQRHGERLSDGWTPIFRLLAVVPSQKEPETTALAFQVGGSGAGARQRRES
jgi:hypothetical protein